MSKISRNPFKGKPSKNGNKNNAKTSSGVKSVIRNNTKNK